MKTLPILLVHAALLTACAFPVVYEDPFTRPQIDWVPSLTLDADAATRILGNRSRLDKVTAYREDGTLAFQSTFRDDALGPPAGKAGALGYMVEEYPSADAARSYMHATLAANRLNPADAVLVDGAELHYFTGGDVVRMVMILKGNRIVRLKVNPVPSRYSLAEFRKVAVDMATRL